MTFQNFPTAAALVKENVEFVLLEIRCLLKFYSTEQRFIELPDGDNYGYQVFELYKKEVCDYLAEKRFTVAGNKISW